MIVTQINLIPIGCWYRNGRYGACTVVHPSDEPIRTMVPTVFIVTAAVSKSHAIIELNIDAIQYNVKTNIFVESFSLNQIKPNRIASIKEKKW